MNLICNGKKIVTNAENVLVLIKELKFDPAVVVVELNKKIIQKDDWNSSNLSEGDSLELISFVGGG